MAQEERFRRLLRWYPRAWRDRNGAALLGTMLDEAERHGRGVPSPAERLSAAVYGLGTRLDRRLALGSAFAALAVAAAGGAVMVWGINSLATVGAAWVLPVLTIAIAPGLITVGAVALARQRGLLSEPYAVAGSLLSLLALAASAVAQVSWGMALAGADRGIALTGLAASWVWWFGTAWVIGAAAIALLVHALLGRSRMQRVASATLAVLSGVLLAPAIGVSLISPYTAAIGAAGLALLTLVSRVASGRPSRPIAPVRRTAAEVPARTRRLARLLAVASAVASAGGVVYALSGTRWSGMTDATAVMGYGITLSLASALPLLAAIGVLVVTRSLIRPLHTWGPLLLAALALAAAAAAYRNAPAWDGMIVGFAIGSALGGAAIAWWLAARLPGSRRSRMSIAVLVGVGYAAFLGILVAPMLAFGLPLAATAFAVWGTRPPRVYPASIDGQAGPSAHNAILSGA